MIPLVSRGYKYSDLLNQRFVDCKTCGDSIVLASTVRNPFKFLALDPKLNKDTQEYNLHVCSRNR